MATLPEGFSVVEDEPELPEGFSVVDDLPEGFSVVEAEEDPTLVEIGGGLAAEVAIAEGAKFGGAAVGTAVLPGIGTAIGYVVGAIGGGVAGSLTAQRIEGREDISYGRVVADTMLNLIPFSKASKGAKVTELAWSAAKRQGVTGAVALPTAQTIEAKIEGEEMPTARELGQSALVGGALGSMLGVSSEAASGLYRKFSNKSAREIEEAILKGDPDAIKLSNAMTDAANIKETDSATPRQALKKLMSYTQARVAPTTLTGKEIFQVAKEAKDIAASSREIGTILGKKIDSAIQRAPDPEVAADQVSAYIMGKTEYIPSSLNSIRTDLAKARVERYKLQKQIIDNHEKGSRVLPEPLVNEVRRSMNEGDYLTREYQFFENRAYKPSKADTQALKSSLRKDGKTDKEIEQFIADLNEKRQGGPDAIRQYVTNTKTGILKERKDLSPELRRYLGEITDPGEKIAGTISRLGRLAAYDTADRRIREMLLESGVAKKVGQGVDQGDMVKLNVRGGISKDADGAEVFVPKDVQRALDAIYAPSIDNKTLDVADNIVTDVFKTGIAASKAAKVILNVPSYMVQVYGNLSTILGMGMNPFRGLIRGGKIGSSQFEFVSKRLSPKNFNKYQRALELDLAQPGATISDIRQGLEGKVVGKKIGDLLNPFGKAYSVPDIAFRISAWENYQSFLRKAAPGLTDKRMQNELEEVAARLTNDTYQNYNFLNRSLRTLSQYGVLGQFAAFSLELMRNQYNQVSLIKRMLSGQFADELAQKYGTVNRKAIREEGLKRLAALTAVYGSTTAGITQYNRIVGDVDEEEEKALRDSVLPDWNTNRELIIQKGEDGKIFYKNASYLIPHAQMIGVGRSAFRGESFGDAVARAFDTLKEDVGGEGSFFMNAIVNAVQNYDPNTGRAITSEAGTARNIQDRFTWMVDEAFQPGTWREVLRATDEQRGQPLSQTALRQAGIRINDTTIEDGAGFKIRNVSESLGQVSREVASARYRLSGEDFEREFVKLSRIHNENFQKIIGHAQDYKTLGLSEDEIISLIRDNGVSGKKALMAINGVIPPLEKVKRVTPSSVWEEMQGEGLSMSQMRRKIIKYPDASMRKKLLRKWEKERTMKRKGIGERERVIKSLGVDDGERASFIYQEMQQSSNPDAVLFKYRRQGIATPEVLRQIRLRQ